MVNERLLLKQNCTSLWYLIYWSICILLNCIIVYISLLHFHGLLCIPLIHIRNLSALMYGMSEINILILSYLIWSYSKFTHSLWLMMIYLKLRDAHVVMLWKWYWYPSVNSFVKTLKCYMFDYCTSSQSVG